MTHDQIACLICVSVLISFLLVSFYIIGSWQKKHRLYYVVYRDLESDSNRVLVRFYKTRSSVKDWIEQVFDDIELVGVYTLVPDGFLKEFGGSILSEIKTQRR